MKAVTYNIQYSLGQDGKYDLPRIVDTVKDADIIALQEVEVNFPRTGMTDQAADIAAMLPEMYWFFGPELDSDASTKNPDGTVTNGRRQMGNMLLSRWPIQTVRNHLLPYIGTTTHFSCQRTMLEGTIDAGGRMLRFNSLHLSHLSQRDRLAQVDAILEINRRVWLDGPVATRSADLPDNDWTIRPTPTMPFDAIYLGDFNFGPEDEEYDRIVGPNDWEFGRVGYRDLLVDAWVAAGHTETDGCTFKANDNYPDTEDGWRLDYCFVTPTLAPAIKSAWIDDDAIGSDHQPMWVEFDW